MPRTRITRQLTQMRTKLKNIMFLQDVRMSPQIVNTIIKKNKGNEKKEYLVSTAHTFPLKTCRLCKNHPHSGKRGTDRKGTTLH